MDIKRKLYFVDNDGELKYENMLINLKMNTGLIYYNESYQTNAIKKKYIDIGIFFPDMLYKSKKYIYFEDKAKCQSLYKIIPNYSPKVLITSLNKNIKITGMVILYIQKILSKTKDKEKLLIRKIKKYIDERVNITERINLINLLDDYRDFVYKLGFDIFHELLYFNENYVDVKKELLSNNKSILVSIFKLITLNKKFNELNQNLLFHSNFYDMTFKFVNKEITEANLLYFIDVIDNQFNKTFLEYSLVN